MADLAIQGQKQTSSWLHYHLSEHENKQDSIATKRLVNVRQRNLSSAGRGTVRSFPARFAYIGAKSQTTTEPGEFSHGEIVSNSASKPVRLQELPNGYFTQADLWLTKKQNPPKHGDNTEDLFINGYPTDQVNMSFPSRGTTAIHNRSKSANQRTLGVTRGDYKRSNSIDSQLADIKQWRSLTPDYVHPSNYPLLNRQQENKCSFHYYGQTRINLDDPTGLFFHRNSMNGGSAQINKEKTGRSENIALVRNARKYGKPIVQKESPRCHVSMTSSECSPRCPIGQPYDYQLYPSNKNQTVTDSNIPKILFKSDKLRFLKHYGGIDIKPFTSDGRWQSGQDKYNKPSNNNIGGNHYLGNILRPNIGGNTNLNIGGSNGPTMGGSTGPIIGGSTNPTIGGSQINKLLVSEPQTLNISTSSINTVVSDDTVSSVNTEQQTKEQSSAFHNNDSNVSIRVEGNQDEQVIRSEQAECKPDEQLYRPAGPKQSTEDLTLSQYFMIRLDKKQPPSKRTVRFKIRDDVREYEPWAPIMS